MTGTGILETRTERLTEKQATELSRWLVGDGAKLLADVIRSKIRGHLATAMEEALVTLYHPLKIEVTNRELELVHRYQTCLDVLNEIKQMPEFTVNKWVNPA